MSYIIGVEIYDHLEKVMDRFEFFFSSRRRHTSLTCDWSSDVCSSDLLPVEVTVNGKSAEVLAAVGYPGAIGGYQVNFRVPSRSEERRVGKECRSRRQR